MGKLKSYSIVLFLIAILVNVVSPSLAQYAPPAGQLGTTAIHADSSIFVDWANTCIIERGYADISNAELGITTYGADTNAVGKSNIMVVSLGDGGVATLTFNTPISDGEGCDFAIFENSFLDDFLELAFVEVSSNGIDYHSFKPISLTQQDTQVGTFGLIDATKIYNLAGKYKAMYGTPFDLHELVDIPGLDVSNIISVRIVDVVGSIDNRFATYDSNENIINDPWPTPFETGGFDLDAVGVINNRNNTSVAENIDCVAGIIFPNPASNFFSFPSHLSVQKVMVFDVSGIAILEVNNPTNNTVNIEFLPRGYYIIKLITNRGIIVTKLIKT